MNVHDPAHATALKAFRFDNSYARDLDGFFVRWRAAGGPAPKMLKFNHALSAELGVDGAALDTAAGAEILAGNQAPEGAAPLAQAYAGHQFGGFSPQLGDGRALLLGEVVDGASRRRDVQLKGAGRTPFSRGGDGKAAIGPVLREYLISEAMHALGVPTTRALAAVATGDLVYRERPLPGAVLTRVASSHIRVGTFQFFAVRGETEKVRQLADYAIARHYPDVAAGPEPYLAFLGAVLEAQAALVAHWMRLGFIHGVMNTDNMTISGETIDYGPCAFMEAYAPETVFSSIDRQGRYAYGNQPPIAQWNLTRLAETLIPLVDDDQETAIEKLTEVVKTFPEAYQRHWLAGMRAKIGLASAEDGDLDLLGGLLTAMQAGGADYTRTYRALADAATGDDAPFEAEFVNAAAARTWLGLWRARLEREPEDGGARATRMNAVNPLYIPRNHKVEEALEAAVDAEDLAPFERLLDVVTRPYQPIPDADDYAKPTPPGGEPYQTFCGT